MKSHLIALVEKQQADKVAALNKKQSELIKQPTERTLPVIQVGDTVDVHFWIELGEKGRTQVFNGTVIAIKGEKPDEFITVRRAKLYYLRNRVGKATRLKERKKGEAQTASKAQKAEQKAEHKAAAK